MALFVSTRPLGGWLVLLRVLRVLVSLSWFGSPVVKVALVSVPFRVPDGGAVRVDAPPGWVIVVVVGPPSAGDGCLGHLVEKERERRRTR